MSIEQNSCFKSILLRDSSYHVPTFDSLLSRNSLDVLSVCRPFKSLVGTICKMNFINENDSLIHRLCFLNLSLNSLILELLSRCNNSVIFIYFLYHLDFYFRCSKMIPQLINIEHQTRKFLLCFYNSI
jgi:hypothetical protein